jgi:hypothetical protein
LNIRRRKFHPDRLNKYEHAHGGGFARAVVTTKPKISRLQCWVDVIYGNARLNAWLVFDFNDRTMAAR